MAKYDAILIPGGGLTENHELPPWTQQRFDKALEMYDGEYLIPLSGGTVHKPLPRDSSGFPLFEAAVEAEYLMSKGIDRTKILPETTSYDTVGNGYFSRVIHTDPRGFRKLLVITSEFHLPRTQALFEWIFKLTPVLDKPYQLDFIAASDEGAPEELLGARREKEARSLAQIRPITERIKTLSDFHAWLYTEHAAYAAGLTPKREQGILLAGY